MDTKQFDYNLELEEGKDFGQGNEYMKYKINKKGNIHGKFITGDCCNSVETVYNYIDGIKEGPSYEYYKNTNIIISECYYKNNELNGKYIEYYNDGNIKIQKNYRNNELYGDYIEYFMSNTIKIKTIYKYNKKNGKYEEYYNTGSKKIQCYYKEDILTGLYNEWHINGLLIKNILY